MPREVDDDSPGTDESRPSKDNRFNESLAFQREGDDTAIQFNPVEEIRPSFDLMDLGRNRHNEEERDFETSLRGFMYREEGASRLTNFREETYRKPFAEDDDPFERTRGNPFHSPDVNYDAERRDYFPGRERSFSPVRQQKEVQNNFVPQKRDARPEFKPMKRESVKAEKSSFGTQTPMLALEMMMASSTDIELRVAVTNITHQHLLPIVTGMSLCVMINGLLILIG